MNINPYLNTSTTMRDYQHAARLFVDSNYRLSPKYGFLFFVEFDLNPLITQMSGTGQLELGMIVKSAALPKFSIENKVMNAYNRVNVVQTKMKYDPIDIVFHDDQGDVARDFWYDYYSFYYRDSDYANAIYYQNGKYSNRPQSFWGYNPRPVPQYKTSAKPEQYQYIQAIHIYSLYQKNFSEYRLMNPTITSFKHGDHANGTNEVLNHSMTVQYEAVKYFTGYVTPDTVAGYVNLHYDSTVSPIAQNIGGDIMVGPNGTLVTPSNNVPDLSDNNTLPSKLSNSLLSMLNSDLSLVSGAISSIAGGLGSTIGSAISGVISGTGATSSLPSLTSLNSSVMNNISGALTGSSSSLLSEVNSLSASALQGLGLAASGPNNATVSTNLAQGAAAQTAINTQNALAKAQAAGIAPTIGASAGTTASSITSSISGLVSSASSAVSNLAGVATASATTPKT